MTTYLALVTIVVDDYDIAIEYYTQKLNFSLVENTFIDDYKRWVVVAPHPVNGCKILLAKATGERQLNSMGTQTGGRVAFFLNTTNFWGDYEDLVNKQVKFIRPPVEQPYGIIAVFEDLYGNLLDLIGAV